jgi:hypothetical protein
MSLLELLVLLFMLVLLVLLDIRVQVLKGWDLLLEKDLWLFHSL